MNTYIRKTKRTKGRKFIGLLIILLISIAALLYFNNKPFVSPLTDNKPTPIVQLLTTNSKSVDNNSDDTSNIGIVANDDLILINKQNHVPDNYKVNLTTLSNGETVAQHIYPALQEMFDAARAQGIYPTVASGYRTAEKQQLLMDKKITAYTNEGFSSSEAVSKAKEWVASPGTSEHQLGLAVDINADGINSSGDAVYTWLADNAHTFGFICRYPADKSNITGINYEPWHYRYVGITAAAEMYQQNLCLEEYLETLN